MLARVAPDKPFDEAAFQQTFRQMDKNSDGLVSKEELFLSLVEKAKNQQAA